MATRCWFLDVWNCIVLLTVMADVAITARAEVAELTRDAHLALHVHPVLVRLQDDTLTVDEYLRVIKGMHQVYTAAEARRRALKVWPSLSLERQCAALERDVHPRDLAPLSLSGIASEAAALGMLYTLHGAQFGASGILKKLERSLPAVPHTFYSLKPDSDLWRRLGAALNEVPVGSPAFDEVIAAARDLFGHVGRAVA